MIAWKVQFIDVVKHNREREEEQTHTNKEINNPIFAVILPPRYVKTKDVRR